MLEGNQRFISSSTRSFWLLSAIPQDVRREYPDNLPNEVHVRFAPQNECLSLYFFAYWGLRIYKRKWFNLGIILSSDTPDATSLLCVESPLPIFILDGGVNPISRMLISLESQTERGSLEEPVCFRDFTTYISSLGNWLCRRRSYALNIYLHYLHE